MEHYSHREGRKMMGETTNGYGTPFIIDLRLEFLNPINLLQPVTKVLLTP